MRRLLLVCLCVLLVSCSGGEGVPDAGVAEAGTVSATPASLPLPGPSVVFGPADAPTGGEITIGLLIETPPSVLLRDAIEPEVWAGFCVREAARATPARLGLRYRGSEDAVLEEVEEVVEWSRIKSDGRTLAEGGSNPSAAALDQAARELLAEANVRVVFLNVLASECEGLAAVFADRNPRYEDDRAHLERYQDAGGLIFRNRQETHYLSTVDTVCLGASRPGLLPDEADDTGVILAVCREVIANAPLVRRLDEDPLALASAERRGDEVVVHLAGSPTTATVHDETDCLVGAVSVGADGVLSFDSPDLGNRPFRERLVVTWTDGDVRLRRAWRVVDLVGTVERRIFAARLADVGAPYAPRALYANTLTGAPTVGRRETVRLVQGERVLAEVEGTTDRVGSLDARLAVPADAAPGAATLEIGDATFPMTIRSGLRVSVVTDRALYRPTDEVHVRVMVHEAARGGPVADQAVMLKLHDVKKTVETSAHGIASATFRLVEAKLGSTSVTADVGGVKGSSNLRVRAFERPTFTVALDPPELTLRPGESAPLRVTATYVNGTPVLGARAHLSGSQQVRFLPSWSGQTDPHGVFETEVHLGPRARSGLIYVYVRDADGREVETVLRLEVADGLRTLTLKQVGEAIAGRPCRYAVEASAPGPVKISTGGEPLTSIEIGEDGRGEVELTTPPARTRLRAYAADARAASTELVPLVLEERQPLVVVERRAACVGETLDVEIRTLDGPVYLDVWRNGSSLRTLSALAANGAARIALVLDADLAGPLSLRAWRLEDGHPLGTSVTVLVARGRALAVTANVGQDSYRPAETAAVDVTVRTRGGEPTAAVLGYWGVDEALLALAPLPDGYEEVFDVVEARSGAARRRLAQRAEDGESTSYAEALEVLGRTHAAHFPPRAFHLHQSVLTYEAGQAEVRAQCFDEHLDTLRRKYVEAFEAVPVESLRTASHFREVLQFIVASGHLPADSLLDPWGTPLRLGRKPRVWVERSGWGASICDWTDGGIFVASVGPDLLWGTADDLRATWVPPRPSAFSGPVARFLALLETIGLAGIGVAGDAPFWGPATNGLIGLGGGAGGAFGGRGGSRDLGGGGGGHRAPRPVHVRKDFDPTLCFVPEAIVGPDGKTRLEIPLKDSITTWRLRLVASAPDGATGVEQTRIRVSQPLHASPWIAPHLTVGDELELPVSVRNETDQVLDVALDLALSEHLVVVGDTSALVSVPPGGTAAHRYRYRATKRGSARIRIDADAGEHKDAIERVVSVRPNAREVIDVANASVSSEQTWTAALPPLPPDVDREHRVSVYPSPLAETLDGFEGLIACPHG